MHDKGFCWCGCAYSFCSFSILAQLGITCHGYVTVKQVSTNKVLGKPWWKPMSAMRPDGTDVRGRHQHIRGGEAQWQNVCFPSCPMQKRSGTAEVCAETETLPVMKVWPRQPQRQFPGKRHKSGLRPDCRKVVLIQCAAISSSFPFDNSWLRQPLNRPF